MFKRFKYSLMLRRQYPSAIFRLTLWAESMAWEAVFLSTYGNITNISPAITYKDTESCHTRSFLKPLLMFFLSIFISFHYFNIFFIIFSLFHSSNFPSLKTLFHLSTIPSFRFQG